MMKCLDDSFQKLFKYVRKHHYEGIDLFDGLNSKLFKKTPLYKSRFFRLALLQFCKHSPINFRKILFVPKGFNPKAGALFLLGNINMYKSTGEEIYAQAAQSLYEKLKSVIIKRQKGIGFGYNFDWQARAFYVPEGTPNVVTSVYVGKAFIEYYEAFKDEQALELAKSIAEFIVNEMIIFEDQNGLCFRYIPRESTQVHNANLLAASYLSLIYKYGISSYTEKVQNAVKFSLNDINSDGSWPYGTMPFHRWVDNFHTAFNIESLMDIQNVVKQNFSQVTQRVIEYYLNNMFTQDGLPKYYNNKLYPIDIHVIAESIIVLNKIKMSNIETDKAKIDYLMQSILKLITNFQNHKGYFYFQKTKYYWNKIPYIRWGQAWMFFALSTLYTAKNVEYIQEDAAKK